MIGLLIAYGAGKSVQRSRQRRAQLPPGYAEFEFVVLMGALVIGVGWPIHLGYQLTKWGLHLGWSIAIAALIGLVSLAFGAGYIVIGIIYSGVWLGLLVSNGQRREQEMNGR